MIKRSGNLITQYVLQFINKLVYGLMWSYPILLRFMDTHPFNSKALDYIKSTSATYFIIFLQFIKIVDILY